jgi:L-alanine-DL-glutamate epimerase-like enolase superfamily enzyme
VLELITPIADRVSYDAPITSVESIRATPIKVRIVNVKPCRVGRLQELSRLYAHCESAGIQMYNGGMGELGVGRGQAQLLASLFHPGAPNDIAPSGYNLPPSPLDPTPDRGFRRR